MKKFNSILLAALVVCLSAVSAFADGSYFSVHAGIGIPTNVTATDPSASADISRNTGYALDVAYGVGVGNNGRVETELGYNSAKTDKLTISGVSGKYSSTISDLSVLINGYYDFKQATPYLFVTPYVGLGVGFAYTATSDGSVGNARVTSSSTDTVFAYKVATGISYDMSNNVALDLGYRYLGTSESNFKNGIGQDSKFKIGNHDVVIGARFKF